VATRVKLISPDLILGSRIQSRALELHN